MIKATMLTLDHFVPWGRSFWEYKAMFALTEADLAGRMLGCGDGPAGFNAEATRCGLTVVSCDPLLPSTQSNRSTDCHHL